MPQFMKVKGKIVKVNYSKEEQTAMDASIRQQLCEYDREHAKDIESLVLDILHREFGFGAGRAKKVYKLMHPALMDLFNRYGAGQTSEDEKRLYDLKKIGVDIEKWEQEN